MENVKIIGTGYATPNQKITNDQLSQVVDTSDTWIQSRTGISSRYISCQENTSDLALRAAQNAIQASGIDPRSIRLILVATLTPDNYTPTVACQVQAGLGLNEQPRLFVCVRMRSLFIERGCGLDHRSGNSQQDLGLERSKYLRSVWRWGRSLPDRKSAGWLFHDVLCSI